MDTYQKYAFKKTTSTKSPMELEHESVISALELVNRYQDEIKKMLKSPPPTTTLVDEEFREVESEKVENVVPYEIR